MESKHYPLTESEKQRLGKYLAEGQRLQALYRANTQMIDDLVAQMMENRGLDQKDYILNLQTMIIIPRSEVTNAQDA